MTTNENGRPVLPPDLARALVEAAGMLEEADRPSSWQALLQVATAQPRAWEALQEAFGRALGRADYSGAEAYLSFLEEDGGQVDPDWVREARRKLDNQRPFEAAALRARLRALTPRCVPGSGPLCYILNMSLPYNTSGYAMRSQELVKALLEAGQQVHCVSRPGFPLNMGERGFADLERVDGVQYHRIRSPSLEEARQTAYMDRAAQALVERLGPLRPRAVMAASNHDTAAPALIAARRLGLPFIYEVRGFWELTKVAVNPSYIHDPQFRRSLELEAEIARRADLVFTLTNAMREELKARGVPAARIALLPNAADPTRFRPRPKAALLAARLRLPPRVPVIGYIGSFTPYEGLDDLIRACGALQRQGHNFRLLLVGDEPRHLKGRVLPDLRRLIGEEQIDRKTRLPGRIPASAVEDWYSLIDLAPIPRKVTAVTRLVSPLKPLEAMAMEKAVLLPDLPPMREIVRDGGTGLLYESGNPQALERALATLLAEPTRRRAIGQAARRWVLEERSWQAVAGRCINSLEELLGGSGPALRGGRDG